MNVIGCMHQSDYSDEYSNQMKKLGIRITTFDEVITTSDYISIHVPLDDTTRGLINEQVLNRMKTGSYIMNLARGGVVDEQALYKALTEGNRLRGAATDVHVNEGEGKISPLAALSNVVLTPHIGAQTVDSQKEIGEIILTTVANFDNKK